MICLAVYFIKTPNYFKEYNPKKHYFKKVAKSCKQNTLKKVNINYFVNIVNPKINSKSKKSWLNRKPLNQINLKL